MGRTFENEVTGQSQINFKVGQLRLLAICFDLFIDLIPKAYVTSLNIK